MIPSLGRMFGPEGQALLETMDLGLVYRIRMESLRDLLEIADREIALVSADERDG